MKIKSGVIIGEIIRVQKTKNFALMDKGFFEDENLSWKATGILGYLLTKPDQWKVIVADLIKRAKDGRDSVYAGLKELKEHGYYSKKPVRNEKGVITHWESVVYESPLDNPEYMASCPLPAFPDTTNPEHSNNNYNNNYNKSKSISDKIQELSERIVGTFAKEKTDMIGCDNTPNPLVDVKEKSSNVIFDSLVDAEDTEELKSNNYVNNYEHNYTKTDEIVNSDFEKTVKENINYDRLLEENVAEKPIIDSFVKIMVDTFKDNSAKNFFNKEVIKDVNGNVVTPETLKDIFSKANFEHLKYTIISFVKSSQRIRKSKIVTYIKTAIYRNFFTYELAKANEECVANPQPVEQNDQQAPATYQRPARKNRFINFPQVEWDFDQIEKLEEEYIENHLAKGNSREKAQERMRQTPTFGLPSFS